MRIAKETLVELPSTFTPMEPPAPLKRRATGEKSQGVETSLLRAKAPIAAHFEDCTQAFQQLCAALKSCRIAPSTGQRFDDLVREKSEDLRLEEIYTATDDCMAKLDIWDLEVGASTRALDHTLRRSSQLSQTVVSHLDELKAILEQGDYMLLDIGALARVSNRSHSH